MQVLINLFECNTISTLTNTCVYAFDLFLYSWAISPTHAPDPGGRILTTETEYGANFVAYLQLARRFGIEVEVVPSNDHGEIDLSALEASIRRTDVGPVTLIALNHIPTNSGLINPAAGVGAIAREYGITYLLDACQSAGQVPLDVDELGCDALTAAGRKGRGLQTRNYGASKLRPSRRATWKKQNTLSLLRYR